MLAYYEINEFRGITSGNGIWITELHTFFDGITKYCLRNVSKVKNQCYITECLEANVLELTIKKHKWGLDLD